MQNLSRLALAGILLLVAAPSLAGEGGGPGTCCGKCGGEPQVAAAEGISNPVVIPESRVLPAYPKKAKEKNIEGKVVLLVVVRKDGTVGDVRVVQSSQPKMGFEKAAIQAVRQWRYQPSRSNGEPVDASYTLIMNFDPSRS